MFRHTVGEPLQSFSHFITYDFLALLAYSSVCAFFIISSQRCMKTAQYRAFFYSFLLIYCISWLSITTCVLMDLKAYWNFTQEGDHMLSNPEIPLDLKFCLFLCFASQHKVFYFENLTDSQHCSYVWLPVWLDVFCEDWKTDSGAVGHDADVTHTYTVEFMCKSLNL